VITPGAVDHLEHEHLCAFVACISESDWQGDLPEVDGLLGRDHSIEWVWTTLELIRAKSQSVKGVEVHEVEATIPIHKCFGEPSLLDQWITTRGNLPGLGILSGWSI
jgi:hypothetical protein